LASEAGAMRVPSPAAGMMTTTFMRAVSIRGGERVFKYHGSTL
jgi:hypothetical protein